MKVVDGCDGQALTQQKITELIRGSEDKGVSIGRMPGIEADALSAWVKLGRDTDKLISTEKDAVFRLQQNTGFYAETHKFNSVLDAWCNIYLESLRSSDLLYRLETDYAARNDFLVADALNEIHVWSATRLHQWVPLLEGKKVLVVTPFKDSVLNQWSKREGLFLTGHIPLKYPNFELEVIQAHNTIFGNKPYPCSDWLGSYREMCEEIKSKEFDLAVLGCGSYGVPLCDYIKSIGKSAFYVGSYCQILFGIRGKRWDIQGNPTHSYFNDLWCNPTSAEVPKNYEKVEDGCYW